MPETFFFFHENVQSSILVVYLILVIHLILIHI